MTDSVELSEWIAYDKYYHLPDEYWLAGLIASTIANANRAKGQKPYEVKDFMPKRPVIRQSEEQIRNHLDSLLGQFF